jgi:hypothetical protein
MQRVKQFFNDKEIVFEDVSVPGWTLTSENIKALVELVENKNSVSAGFVFDLLGNSSVRFEQFDGSTAMPFKSGGIFHLGGRVTLTPLGNFRIIIELVLPIFKAKGNKPSAIVPPIPDIFSHVVAWTVVTAPI